MGGVILALIEGLGVALGRATAPPPQGMPAPGDMAVDGAGGPGPMEGQPADGEKKGLLSGLSGMFGGEEKTAPAPVEVHDLSDDKYGAPKMPDFGAPGEAARSS